MSRATQGSSARSLVVWSDESRVGNVSSHRGSWSFSYAAEWLPSPDAFPLSPWFPLSVDLQSDHSDDRRVEWYFDNLLPEGGVRRALARFADLDDRDTFGLLREFGEESAGALTLLPAGVIPPAPSSHGYSPLTLDDLRALLAGLPEVPLLVARGRAKMSLAGAQHKLGVHLRGEELFLPASGAASSYILKPDNARSESYPFCPANEHFVMSLARAVGLPVPATKLVHLPEPVYVVERYDRRLEGDFAPGQFATPAVSKDVTIDVDTIGPPPPTGLVTMPGDGRISVHWDEMSGAGITGVRAFCELVTSSSDGGTSEATCASSNLTSLRVPDGRFLSEFGCGMVTGNAGTSINASDLKGPPLVNRTRLDPTPRRSRHLRINRVRPRRRACWRSPADRARASSRPARRDRRAGLRAGEMGLIAGGPQSRT